MKNISLEKQRLIDANKFLVLLRWVYLTSLLVTGVISKMLPGVKEAQANANFPVQLIATMAVVVFGLNLVWYIYFRHGEKRPIKTIKFISIFQLVFDITAITAVTYFAGGLNSISFMYHFYPIIASAFLFSFLTTISISLLAVFLYGGMIIAQYFYWIPYLARYNIEYESLQAHNPSAVFTNLSAILPGFLIVGLFAGTLAYRIRRKEKEVRIERDKEKAIIDNMEDGLLYINNAGIVEELNPKAEKLLNLKGSDVIGKKADKLDAKRFVILDQVLKFDPKTDKELVPRGKSDTVYNIYSVETKDEEDRLIGTTIIIHDATRQKFVENMKSEFITIAGHQLRTPLTGLKSSLELLLLGDYGDISQPQEKMLRQSYENSEKLIKLVGDLLNVSSIEEGQFDYKFESTDMHNLLRGVCDRLATQAERKHIDFRLKIINDLSEIAVDPYKLRLAIVSVVDNAISYTEEGGEVEIRGMLKDNLVEITIEDNGIGIPRKHFAKIFTKFFRADNAVKHKTEGSGLNLFVAKNIIDNHQGKIWFESEESKGTTFHIEIPANKK